MWAARMADMRGREEPEANLPPDDPGEQGHLWRAYVERLRDVPEPFEAQWARFQQIHSRRRPEDGPPLVWRPGPEQLSRSNIGSLMREVGVDRYEQLHRWSVEHKDDFWRRVIQRLGIEFSKPPRAILDLTRGVKDPEWLPGAELNCTDSCFKAPSEQPAIVSGREGSRDVGVTRYGELEAQVRQVAGGLAALGFERGDAIGVYMPMNVQCVAAYLGIVSAGCRVVSIADSFSPTEVRRRLEIAGACAIVTMDHFVRAGKRMALYDKVREAEAPRAIVLPAEEGVSSPLRAGDLSWADLLAAGEPAGSVAGHPDDLINVLFSSGTTSTPKAIGWTHLTPLKCAMDGHLHQDIHPDDVVAWPTNIGWMMGPWLIFATLINRATMALYEGAPTGSGFGRFVEDGGVTILGLIPSLVRAWRSSGTLEACDWRGVRVFTSTGEPSNQPDFLWLMSRADYEAPVIEYLGGTEIGGGHLTGSVAQPASPATFTTPALGIDVVVLDEAARPVPEGGSGELFLIPPALGLSQRLLNKDHEEVYYADTPAGPDGEVLRRHGDEIARLHGGFFRAQGRADDTMNLGGIKISSLELEQVLDTHEAVYESAAVAVQPEGGGAERLVVHVVLHRDMDGQTLRKELQTVISGRLNPLFRIHDLVTLEKLPRTASNKLIRRTLRAEYEDRTRDQAGPAST